MLEVVSIDQYAVLMIYDYMDGTQPMYHVRLVIDKGEFHYDEALEYDYGSLERAIFNGKKVYYNLINGGMLDDIE